VIREPSLRARASRVTLGKKRGGGRGKKEKGRKGCRRAPRRRWLQDSALPVRVDERPRGKRKGKKGREKKGKAFAPRHIDVRPISDRDLHPPANVGSDWNQGKRKKGGRMKRGKEKRQNVCSRLRWRICPCSQQTLSLAWEKKREKEEGGEGGKRGREKENENNLPARRRWRGDSPVGLIPLIVTMRLEGGKREKREKEKR